MKKILIILIIMALNVVFSQPYRTPHHYKQLNIGRSDFNKNTSKSNQEYEVYSITLSESNAPFLRLSLGNTDFGKNSYIKITSLMDNKSQILTNNKLKKWKYSSMFFNGGELLIEFYKSRREKNFTLDLDKILVGEKLSDQIINSIQSICGSTDDRVASSNEAIGRVDPVGGTAWITPTGKLITAGHCVTYSALYCDGFDYEIIEFNVPASLSDGTIQHPGEEDQYIVASYEYEDEGDSDWTVFTVEENTETGLYPIEAQGTYIELERTDDFISNEDIRITGYGVDGPSPDFGADDQYRNEDSQTQQTDIGYYYSLSGTIIQYVVDTQGGDSGAPIIRESNGKAVGVHTNGGCNTDGYNYGITFLNDNFWNEAGYTIIDQVLADGETSIGTIAIWNGSSFGSRQTVPRMFTFPLNSNQTTHADTSVYNNQKYNNWNDEAEVTNHKTFTITSQTELRSNFGYTYSDVVIKNNIENSSLDDGYIKFKDPWLIDSTDSKGNMNRGSAAIYNQVSSPFNPNTSGSGEGRDYNGVFLAMPIETGKPYYSVKADQTQTVTINGSSHTMYFQNWSATDASLQYPNQLTSGVVFTDDNAVITANYKADNLTNTASTFSHTNKRQVVQTNDGTIHKVYESMGRIWYEVSTDNGTSWSLANGAQPVGGDDCINPCIITAGTQVGIVCYDGDNLDIRLFLFNQSGAHIETQSIYQDWYPHNTDLVAVWDYPGTVMVVFTEGSGYYYFTGDPSSSTSWTTPEAVSNTNSSSSSMSITSDKSSGDADFYLAWKQSSSIKHMKIYYDTGLSEFVQTGYTDVSSGSGLSDYHSPTIGMIGSTPAVAFIGEHGVVYNDVVSLYVNGNYYSYSYQDENMDHVNLNNHISGCALVCGGENITNRYINSSDLTDVTTLSGTDPVQVSNGRTYSSSYSDMCAIMLNKASSPYPFQLLSYGLAKDNKNDVSINRELSINTKEGSFLFSLGGVEVDGEKIRMVDKNAIEKPKDLTESESYLTSEEFTLNKNVSVKFDYYFTPLYEKQNLTENEVITAKLVFIDADSQEELETLRKDVFNSENKIENKILHYGIATENVQERKVRLQLKIAGESVKDIALITRCDIGEELNKEKDIEMLTLEDLTIPEEFNLAQNYPNPFNPTTTIKYELPSEGQVTIKVFDVLGKEIATLIDEKQISGRYEVTFNGEGLASSMYIYRIDVKSTDVNFKDYSSVRKMLLIK